MKSRDDRTNMKRTETAHLYKKYVVIQHKAERMSYRNE